MRRQHQHASRGVELGDGQDVCGDRPASSSICHDYQALGTEEGLERRRYGRHLGVLLFKHCPMYLVNARIKELTVASAFLYLSTISQRWNHFDIHLDLHCHQLLTDALATNSAQSSQTSTHPQRGQSGHQWEQHVLLS